MKTVDEAMNHAQDQLQCAFEKWLTDECPSGDCESVERLWNESFVHQELIDELQPVMALTWEVRRLREDNERLRAVLESACEKMKQCRYVEARSDMLQAIDAARGAK